MRMVVVLPAPLGPRKPTISPRATSKLTRSMAWTGPKNLERFWTLIMRRFLHGRATGEARRGGYSQPTTVGEPGKFGPRKPLEPLVYGAPGGDSRRLDRGTPVEPAAG